eukprot:1385533-Amorphochlora_amoeboformis.AAC.1
MLGETPRNVPHRPLQRVSGRSDFASISNGVLSLPFRSSEISALGGKTGIAAHLQQLPIRPIRVESVLPVALRNIPLWCIYPSNRCSNPYRSSRAQGHDGHSLDVDKVSTQWGRALQLLSRGVKSMQSRPKRSRSDMRCPY